ncbi:MAG: hypothetical protein JEZ11_24100 [Desulfobacterales bacterium]|nr:hypothetical protein [Desulfobacterales bacterium]
MCDFDDDFGDYDDGGFGDDGSIEDDSVDEGEFCEDMPGDDTEGLGDLEDKMGGSEANEPDEITSGDAFFLGSAMGWAYEEGREEAERRRLIKKEWHKSKKNE